MIKGIVYHSHSGFTKQYAEILSKELDIPCYDIKQNRLNNSSEIIYMGNIFGSRIEGYNKVIKNYNVKILIAVGITEESTENNNIIKKSNNISHDFFYIRGGIDKSKLKGIRKMMLSMVAKATMKNDPSNQLVDAYINDKSFVDKNNLKEIIAYYKKISFY